MNILNLYEIHVSQITMSNARGYFHQKTTTCIKVFSDFDDTFTIDSEFNYKHFDKKFSFKAGFLWRKVQNTVIKEKRQKTDISQFFSFPR